MAELKTSTLFVSNLPQEITTSEIEDVFSHNGPIKRCFIVKQKGSDKGRGFGYVTFSLHEDAKKTVNEGVSYKGRKLVVKFADKKQKSPKAKEEVTKSDPLITAEVKIEKRHKKQLFKKKKHRLIVRNLSFQAGVKDIKTYFETKGKVMDINIPTSANGKKRGFCFVQFENIASASKALKELNGSEIKGRRIAVDWAVSKEKFANVHDNGGEIEDEGDSNSEIEDSKIEPQKSEVKSIGEKKQTPPRKRKILNAEDSDSAITSGEDDDRDVNKEVEGKRSKAPKFKKRAVAEFDNESVDSSLGDDEDEENEDELSERDSESEESEHESDSDDDSGDGSPKKKMKQVDVGKKEINDVEEGKTVFVRNIPYETDEEVLEECFEQWGDVKYVMLVIDKVSLHPKGTAFVKFNTTDAANTCVEDSAKKPVLIGGRTLSVLLAMKSSDVAKVTKKQEEKQKDGGRNLWLARIGAVRQGTQEANTLSPADLAKRMKIEAVKRQKLKNPSIFVSPTRLCVHNIPVSCDNKKLKGIFLKSAGDKEAQINECRIMCDMARVNAKGVPKSKGYAFVNFTQHKHALKVLNNINNNPEIFGEKKKLIVEFSLENRMALAAKEKRMERIQVKQAMLKGENKRAMYTKVKLQKQLEKKDKEEPLKAPQKGTMAMPSHSGPKIRHKKRQPPQGKKAKKVKKQTNQFKEPIKEKQMKMPGKKSGMKPDAFDSLVAKYKSKLTPTAGQSHNLKKSSKWFQ